jgi:predicted MPP superfamily phosphohydrolase
MTYRAFIVVLVSIATLGPVAWGQSGVQGIIFEDINGNGRREPGEPGMPGVVVSNQVDCVATGSDGTYEIDMGRGYGIVFVSVPATHRAVGPFWKAVAEEDIKSVEFALVPASAEEEFSFIHASDTHLSEKNLPRLRQLRRIVEDKKPSFVLITGDLIDDALRVSEEVARPLYELYRREIEDFPVPVYSVPGNHEIFGIERHLSIVGKDHPLYGKTMYRKVLGPDYYSFQFGQVRFIGLNSVDYDDLWYYGHLDKVQLDWLDRELTRVPEGSTVVTFGHMPFFSAASAMIGFDDDRFVEIDGARTYRHTVSNAQEALEHLNNVDHTLTLAGHIHYREKLELEGVETRFHNAPAVGRPNNRNPQLPSGVILYIVRGTDIDDGEFIPLAENP